MRILLLGCGVPGRSCAYDLAQAEGIREILLADSCEERLRSLRQWLESSFAPGAGRPRIELVRLDARNPGAVAALARGCRAIVNASPSEFALSVTRAALEASVSLVDLGGDTSVTLEQLKL